MPTSAGTKVKDYTHAVPESVGVVTSDSLAAESLKNSGAFGSNNPKAAASMQPSHSTTTNTTDTSNARVLPPAPDAETRDAQLGRTADQELDEGVGHGKELGRGPTYNIKHENDAKKDTSNSSSNSNSTSNKPSSDRNGGGATTTTGHADNKPSSHVPKPNPKVENFPVWISATNTSRAGDFNRNGGEVLGGYAGADHKALDPGVLEPKGKNLRETEAELEGKRDWNPEIGSEEDPGRLAEREREERALRPAADAASTKSKLVVEESRFGVLGESGA
ncbi:hypothetical protein DM02DRAFT_673905 [Periconia macrospinosa]|uniref:Pal1-domain-containing protein n=1 Tax=Periconia macrospinosa TaxID=97972 RepID=A0A2V1DIS2_9PLEO|nr:hypothetical protein DM02DRAFT_673905 [Periconia macrospinosa]